MSTSDPTRIQVLVSASQTIVDYYWDTRCTLLCKTRLLARELSQYEEDPTRGLLFYKGRLAQDSKVAVVDLELLDLSFLDGQEITFCNPCTMPDSIIFYAYAIWVHLKSAPHMGHLHARGLVYSVCGSGAGTPWLPLRLSLPVVR